MRNKNAKHWLVLIVCCGLTAVSIGFCVNAVGVFYTPVSESLGIMRGTFAMHATISALMTAVVSLCIPKLMKRYSFKVLLIVGLILVSGSTVLMAFSNNIFMFYILGAVRGASSALFGIVPVTMIINQWFDKKHGLATSIVLSFSGIAGAVGSPIFAYFIESLGWQTTYIIKGILMILLCLPAILYPFSVDPKDSGVLPYGLEKDKAKDAIISKSTGSFSIFNVTFICFFVFAILHTAITGITQHLPGFSESIGQSATLGAMLLSAGMIGNIVSKLFIGVISDKLGAVKATIIMLIVNMIGIILLISVKNTIGLLVGSVLFGSVYSAGAVGFALLTKEFFGNENYTKVFPIVTFATNTGGAFALSLVGYIYDFTGTYRIAFMIAIGINIINMILLAIVVRKTRNKTSYVMEMEPVK
ncbi:MAG: MFS transporter [Coprobacillaceae bacterium]